MTLSLTWRSELLSKDYPQLEALVVLRVEGRRLGVQGVSRVGVKEQLGQEHVEDVNQVEHRGPGLIDDIKTYRARPKMPKFKRETLLLINVRVEYSINEANRGTLVRVLFRKDHSHPPYSLHCGSELCLKCLLR